MRICTELYTVVQTPQKQFRYYCCFYIKSTSKKSPFIQEEDIGSNTEPWPEIDHIQSINGIIRIDLYKTILLVERQRIEYIIDTGSPVTIIPPIMNPKNMKAFPKCNVDVNKNPIKFKGEAMVEVKAERNQ